MASEVEPKNKCPGGEVKRNLKEVKKDPLCQGWLMDHMKGGMKIDSRVKLEVIGNFEKTSSVE